MPSEHSLTPGQVGLMCNPFLIWHNLTLLINASGFHCKRLQCRFAYPLKKERLQRSPGLLVSLTTIDSLVCPHWNELRSYVGSCAGYLTAVVLRGVILFLERRQNFHHRYNFWLPIYRDLFISNSYWHSYSQLDGQVSRVLANPLIQFNNTPTGQTLHGLLINRCVHKNQISKFI